MTSQGRTPLRVALLDGSLDIAGLLLDNGADIDYVDTDTRWGQPPIQLSTVVQCSEKLLFFAFILLNGSFKYLC